MDLPHDRAFAIKIGERYFYSFGKKGQVKTAWSLAGAKLFAHESEQYFNILTKLIEKGKPYKIVIINDNNMVFTPQLIFKNL